MISFGSGPTSSKTSEKKFARRIRKALEKRVPWRNTKEALSPSRRFEEATRDRREEQGDYGNAQRTEVNEIVSAPVVPRSPRNHAAANLLLGLEDEETVRMPAMDEWNGRHRVRNAGRTAPEPPASLRSHNEANDASASGQPRSTVGSSSDHSIYHSSSEGYSSGLHTPNSSFQSASNLFPYSIDGDEEGKALDITSTVFDGVSASKPPLLIEMVLDRVDTGLGRTESSSSPIDTRILEALDALDCADDFKTPAFWTSGRFLQTIPEEDPAALSAYPSARSLATTSEKSRFSIGPQDPSSQHLFPQENIADTAQQRASMQSINHPVDLSRKHDLHPPLRNISGRYISSLSPSLSPRSLVISSPASIHWAPIFSLNSSVETSPGLTPVATSDYRKTVLSLLLPQEELDVD